MTKINFKKDDCLFEQSSKNLVSPLEETDETQYNLSNGAFDVILYEL